jgi:hypothetical protein
VAAEPVSPDPAKSPELEVFPSGPWKGMNAVFQARNFDATIDKDRVLRIQPKQDGANIGAAVLVRFSAYYTDDGRSYGRDLISLEKRPAPAMQPKKVEFAGHYDKKVRFSFNIQFSEQGVTVGGEMKDPPLIKHPTVLAYAAYFTASHQIPANTPPEEIKQLTGSHTVKFTDAKKQTETKQFWEIEKTRSNAIASAEVSGPWSARRVIVEMPATQRNARRIGNYGNYAVTAFYKGGWYFSRAATDKVEGGPLTVRVE